MNVIENLKVFLPALSEQQSIIELLTNKTSHIDSLISKKEKLIDLLKEYRTAIINEAVTKGLDPHVLMKDSGIEWIGKIPKHWDIIPIRRLINYIDQGWSPIAEDRQICNEEWGVIKLNAVKNGIFYPDQHKTLPNELKPLPKLEIKEGDFIISRSNTPELVGDVCVVEKTYPRLMLCDLVYRLSLDKTKIDKNFLAYWLLSSKGRFQIRIDAHGSSASMVKISQTKIRSWLCLLPSLAEQNEIIRFIKEKTDKIDRIINKTQNQISLLKEYRTSLISEVVTGKIDVREDVS